MALPPGEEDIDYNGFRLEVRRFGSGWRILIYALEGFFSFRGFNFPAHRNLRVSEEVENLLR